MENVINKLRQHESPNKSRWRNDADFRRENKSWLRHSQFIAMLMLDKMEDLDMTQKALASQMNVSQQYISKILKGRENLSLETLAKIEDILHINILVPDYDYD
ncbi:MAG: helix-turn-helix domain-containing protein [Candidatus Symbiothrix sp.]|jgi:ribosome-binding protein aMBF1 (putative translation factor)|nr:helix-turn-helix domain-containing protein [Candidatus Symbiothrix sp.]